MAMLRVLVLSTLFPDVSRPRFGSFVERQSLELAARADTELRIVAPRGLPPWPIRALPRYRQLAALPEHEEYKGLGVYRPAFLNLPLTGGRFHAAALARALAPSLEAIARDFPFDVIAAEFFFPDGVAAVELGRRLGVPVSIKARGSDIHRWGRLRATAPQIRAAGCAADGMLAVSEAMRGDMIALGMPADRIQSIVTGVDLERFAPADRAEAKAALGIAGRLILSVGALIPLKGHDIVLRALAALPDATLCVAGDGPERARLAALAATLGIEKRVRLLGNIPHAELSNYLAAADVMALASEREGLANAWLEALASGTPIVIPDVGGARQVVRSPVAGRLVARTPGAFAAGIGEILAAPPSPPAVRATVEPFTWAANAQRLHDYFAHLVSGHRMGQSLPD